MSWNFGKSSDLTQCVCAPLQDWTTTHPICESSDLSSSLSLMFPILWFSSILLSPRVYPRHFNQRLTSPFYRSRIPQGLRCETNKDGEKEKNKNILITSLLSVSSHLSHQNKLGVDYRSDNWSVYIGWVLRTSNVLEQLRLSESVVCKFGHLCTLMPWGEK